MVFTLSFFLYSLVGLCITYLLKINSFMKLTAICRQEKVTISNFMYNSSDRVLNQADMMLKHADMFESFKHLTYLAIVGVLAYSILIVITG